MATAHIRFFPSGYIDVNNTGLYADPSEATTAIVALIQVGTTPALPLTYGDCPNAMTDPASCVTVDSLAEFHEKTYGKATTGNGGAVILAIHDILYPAPPPEE